MKRSLYLPLGVVAAVFSLVILRGVVTAPPPILAPASCLATARESGGAPVFGFQENVSEEALGRWLDGKGRPPGQLRRQTEIRPGEAVSVCTTNPWGASAWSEVSGVDRFLGDSRIALNGEGLYARTSSLRAISGQELERMRPKRPKQEQVAGTDWCDAFAMTHFHFDTIALPDREGLATVMWSNWTRDSGTVGCAIYRVKDGVPEWAYAQMLWYYRWCDGEVELVRSGSRRQLAGVVAFQPPFRLILYRWRDGKLVPGCPGWSVLWRVPRVVVLSYHRWLELLSPLMLVVLIVWTLRRRRRRKAAAA